MTDGARYAYLSMRAYDNAGQLADLSSQNRLAGFELVRYIENKDTDTQAVIGKWNGIVVVAFPGTASTADVLTDLQAFRAPWGLAGGAWVHKGGLLAMLSVSEELREEVRRLDPELVVVCGHSLGGLLAYLFAFYLSMLDRRNCHVYTYGAPRPGGRGFRKRYRRKVRETIAYVFLGDIIPHLPSCLTGWVRPVKMEKLRSRTIFMRIVATLCGPWPTMLTKKHSAKGYYNRLGGDECAA